MWEVCQDRGLPVNFHIGGSEQVIDWFGMQGWPSLAREQRAVIGGAMMNMNNGRVMANIIMSGLLDRYPRLKFVSVESGIGWIPGLMEALDYQHREFGAGGTLEKPPSAYFASNIWACFWFETRNRAHSIRAVGVDNVMFETDFPHPTCLFPLDADLLAMPDLTAEEREKVLSRNAAGVYGIPVD
jgi:predicted TIM-barrel fold metal-dependent hydrolase